MKLLIACNNCNGLGGSELYHYELCRELSSDSNIDVTLLTLRSIDPNDQVRKKLNELRIKQIDTTYNDADQYDLIVASQPNVNNYVIKKYTAPIISIIHSELRSEDPVIHDRIKHYITIRPAIADLLINHYNIPKNKISLIYNPINTAKYNCIGANKLPKTSVIYIGNLYDPLRIPSFEYLINKCVELNWDLYIMSNYYNDLNLPSNVKIIPMEWDNQHWVKQMHYTAGIMLGRTTLEGLHCGVTGMIFDVNVTGSINKIIRIDPAISCDIVEASNSKFVRDKHIKLYTNIIYNGNKTIGG